jgi:hypothetical protein
MVSSQAARAIDGAQVLKDSRPIGRRTAGAMRSRVLVGAEPGRDDWGSLRLVTHGSSTKMQATKKTRKRFGEISPSGGWKETNMAIPEGTRQFVGLREVAERLGLTHEAVKHWWKEGRLIGRVTEGATRPRVVVPIEVLNFYLRYFRLPSKRELFELGALTREYLLELGGPDGGLRELGQEAPPVVTH